jgi:hypothetical protein
MSERYVGISRGVVLDDDEWTAEVILGALRRVLRAARDQGAPDWTTLRIKVEPGDVVHDTLVVHAGLVVELTDVVEP